jgi:hypothetical protein
MSVDPGAPVAAAARAAGLAAFFAPADFEGFLAPDATRLAGAFAALFDFFALVFAMISIHLLVIVQSRHTSNQI